MVRRHGALLLFLPALVAAGCAPLVGLSGEPTVDAGSGGSSVAGGAGGSAGAEAGASDTGGAVALGGSSGIGGSADDSGAGGTPGAPDTGPYCTQPVTPCGGSLIGSWSFGSSCVTLAATDPTAPPACQGLESFQRYVLTGSLTYTASTWQLDLTQSIQESLQYTTACIAALHTENAGFPAPPASLSTCTTIGRLKSTATANFTCQFVQASGSCDCIVLLTGSGTSSDTYTPLGVGKYVNASDPAGYSPTSYCVQDSGGQTTLTFSQTTDTMLTVQHVLTKT